MENGKSRYWIGKDRYFELKYFCLQYKNWERSDKRTRMIEDCIAGLRDDIGPFILIAVTEGLSYSQLLKEYSIRDDKDEYYDAFRKFFWLLDKKRK